MNYLTAILAIWTKQYNQWFNNVLTITFPSTVPQIQVLLSIAVYQSTVLTGFVCPPMSRTDVAAVFVI